MSNPHDLNAPTYFENRRTQFNSMHQIDEERVSGCQPAQRRAAREHLTTPSSRFPPSPRQYEAHEFGLCEDEQFRHPRMFENLNYDTNAGAFEAMRAKNARPPYQRQPQFNVCDLPSEQLEDFSNPQFSEAYDEDDCNVCPQQAHTPDICDISAPDFCDISDASPWPDQTPPRRVQSPKSQKQRQSYTNECLDDESAPTYESPAGSRTPQLHYTPIRLLDTPDVCAPTPPASTPTPPPYFSPIRFQPSPVQYPSECLEDVSVPSFARTPCNMPTPPSPPRLQMPQDLPSDMVCDVSPPSFGSPPTPSLSFPSEALDELTMPSFENASCGSPLDRRFLLDSRLADESPPSFAASGASSGKRSYSRGDTPCPTSAPSPPAYPTERSVCRFPQQYEPTPIRRRSSPPRRFNLAQLMSQRSSPQSCPSIRTQCPSSLGTSLPPAPHYSMYSPAPVGGTSFPSECLSDVSEPTYFSSPTRALPQTRPFPGSLPSECIGDITEPSYQMTPPARTPSMPCDLPSEQICDMSQPMYDSPRSEHLSSMSMPSFEDASCGSPLDRRFLLDPRIMDESPPSFASSRASSPRSSSPCRSISPCAQPATLFRSHSPCPQSSRAATPQRSLHTPCFMSSPRQQRSRSPSPVCPPTSPAPHFSLRSPTPLRSPPMPSMPTNLTDECLTDISEPAYFSGPPRASPDQRHFPSNMTSECLADISAPSYEMTPPPRTPSMPQNLPSDMLCDMSPPMYQSPASEHLSGESMPSFADTSCGSPLDRRFLLDPCLADETMPSMVSSRSRTVSPDRSTPTAGGDSSFDQTYCEILQRFNALKCKMDTSQSSRVGSVGMASGECIRETVIERTENENGQLESTTQHIVVTVDPCGSVKTHTKEIKTKYPQGTSGRLAPPSADSGVLTASPRPAAQIENLRSSIRRRLSFDLSDMPRENLADMSSPCADDLPSMSTENILQHLSSVPEEQLINVSAPSFGTPQTPSASYPCEMLEEMSMPSFENASCGSPLDRRFLLDPRLADESPLKFASSYETSPPASYATHPSGPSRSGYSPYKRSGTPTSSPTRSPQSAFTAENLMREQSDRTPFQRQFSYGSSSPRATSSPTPVTPAAPHFSLHSPSPIGSPSGRPFPTNLPSEQLTNISEPAFFSGPPRATPQRHSLLTSMPSERLDDISQPSYQKTPPPRTPGTPSNLPSEMLGNISAPSYRSPASEHISSVSMPSFEDVSYESPLDRRFLLDPRIADETMPSLPGTPSTQQSPGMPRSGAARRRLSYSQPDSSRGSVTRDGDIRSNSEGRMSRGKYDPATVEQTHTTIKQSGTYQQEHSVTPGASEGSPSMARGQHRKSPLMDAAKEHLKISTSIISITHKYPEGSKKSPTGGQARRRSMSLPSENLGDISMPSGPPSMGMSTTGRSQQRKMSPASQYLNDISMPSAPPSMLTSTTGRSTPRTRRRRSVQDLNNISPISFASTIPSTDISRSTPGRGTSSKNYRSTSSRGFSGMANYAPFFEQIRSRNNSNSCDRCDPCSPCHPTIQQNNPYDQNDTC